MYILYQCTVGHSRSGRNGEKTDPIPTKSIWTEPDPTCRRPVPVVGADISVIRMWNSGTVATALASISPQPHLLHRHHRRLHLPKAKLRRCFSSPFCDFFAIYGACAQCRSRRNWQQDIHIQSLRHGDDDDPLADCWTGSSPLQIPGLVTITILFTVFFGGALPHCKPEFFSSFINNTLYGVMQK